jgi:hypothetical protein
LLVLFAGIRRKHEILKIFLYYLFLVGTDMQMEKQRHSYEKSSISGAGMHGQPLRSLLPGNFTSVQNSHYIVLCTVRVSPLGYPFVRHGMHAACCMLHAACSLAAVRDDRKGKKTHAETIHTVDTTADGARADRDVLGDVAHGVNSCCWAW